MDILINGKIRKCKGKQHVDFYSLSNEETSEGTYSNSEANTLSNDDFIDDEEMKAILNGSIFHQHNIRNFVDNDFYHWVHGENHYPQLKKTFRLITQEMSNFDFSKVDEDILKGVYQELIDLEKLFYKLTGTNNILHKIDSSKKDVEVMLSNIKGDWTWQDGYNGTYFQEKYKNNLPSITFQELINSELIIPIW